MATQNTANALAKGINHMIGDSKYEIQRTNNYEVQIVGLENLTDMLGNRVNGSSRAGEVITLATTAFEAPTISIDPVVISYGNGKVKYAQVGTFGDCSITLNDYIGYNTERILSAWFAQAYNPYEEIVGYANDYKKTAYLIEYDSKYIGLRSYNAENGGVRQITRNSHL